jgi:hypothetical protein
VTASAGPAEVPAGAGVPRAPDRHAERLLAAVPTVDALRAAAEEPVEVRDLDACGTPVS